MSDAAALSRRSADEVRDYRRLLLVLAGLSAFGPLTTDVYLPGFPNVAAELDASAAGVQLTLTSCVIGLAVGQLLAGPVSDMVGRRRPLLLGLGAFVLASLACAAAPSLPLLVGARLVQGVAGAAGIVVARAMVRDLFSGAEAGRVYSTLNAIVTSGPIFAPLIGAGVLLFTDWRGLFVALAAIGAALLAATVLWTAETLPPRRRHANALDQTFHNAGDLLTHRRYMAFSLAGAFSFGTMFAYISASSFVYQDVFGMSAQLYSVLFALNGLALMSSNLLNGRLVGRIPGERLLLIGLLGLAAASFGVAAAVIAGGGAAVVLPLVLVTVAATGVVVSNSVTLAMEGEPARAGSASALFGLLQFSLGAMVAPLVGVEGSSAIPMGIAMAVTASLALAAYLLLDDRPHGFRRSDLLHV